MGSYAGLQNKRRESEEREERKTKGLRTGESGKEREYANFQRKNLELELPCDYQSRAA